jgi:Sterol-sensing domain of SREBP cleavage-activation
VSSNVISGVVIGVVRPELLIGNATPHAGKFSKEYPLESVGVLQTTYAAAQPSTIQRRVRSCKRPGGSVNITRDDAREILYELKKVMEETWSNGWDDATQNVSFVFFSDDTAVGGTAARLLQVVTMDNTALMAVSTALIGIFSIIFLFSFDIVESRVLITLVGVSLIVLGYFAGLGLGILLGIKINISVAWSLPFIIIGLGVDDVYILLYVLPKR